MNNTKTIIQAFQVNFEFNLIFTSLLFQVENNILVNLLRKTEAKTKAIIVLDSGVSKCWPNLKNEINQYFNHFQEQITLKGEILEVTGGEDSKNDESIIQSILEKVNDFKIDRHSYIIAIGGGAVLDAVGYAAAISHRGVRLIRVPTTILSQNDSGVGVKNSINYFNKKNFVGTFAVPYAVINDDRFLSTLDIRDWRGGISEAIKVALIKDYSFFEWIEKNVDKLNNRDLDTMNELIYRCADLHMKHIKNSGDAFEQGSSRPLDFGHWAAHKLEQLSNYQIRHGEAVAIGIALDSTYSFLENHISEIELKRILDCILNLGFTITYPEMNNEIIIGLEEFREHLGGKLTIMLLNKLGTGFEVNTMNNETIIEAITYMANYENNF